MPFFVGFVKLRGPFDPISTLDTLCPRVHVQTMQSLESEPNGSQSNGDGTQTTEPRTSQALAVTSKRTLANRRNAQKSTGPRSTAGKAIAAQNSRSHSIFASVTVLRTLETTREWNSYHAAMITDMAPLGMLETTLAERVISSAWRLRRVLRYETGQVQLTLDSGTETIAAQLRAESQAAAARRYLAADLAIGTFEELLSATYCGSEEDSDGNQEGVSDDQRLHEDDAKDFLSQTHARLDRAADFASYWRKLQKPEAWTVGFLRELIRKAADEHRGGIDNGLAAQTVQNLAQFRADNLLPSDEAMEKVIRYEGHLSRQLHRDLHELQRLQAARQGHRVPVPVVVDVDVATGPGNTPENGG